MKKLLLLLVMTLLPLVASADAVEIDGIYYNLIEKGKIAEVTSNPNKYSGIIEIPESVTYNSDNFSVTSLGKSAFYGCTSLTSITIPTSVTAIGDNAFSRCSGLTSITIPNSVTSIGDSFFSECSGLTSITIPNSVTSIGDYAFWRCTSLTSITIPTSVTSIGSYAIWGCTSLTSITIPTSVISIGYEAFSACSGLTSITIPSSVTSIGTKAFRGCTSLTSITIPSSVTSIGTGVFSGCTSLTSITIPTSVTSIGNEAFANCTNLADVYCYADKVPSTNLDAFKDSYIEYATLYVPEASINEYQKTEPWSGFKNIKALNGDTPETPQCATPTISYKNGKLTFNCETDGVEFITDITNSDIKKHYDATINLTATYNISVYATKSGYKDSEMTKATLCWIDAEPKTEGITDGVANIPSKAALIQSQGGIITIQGIDDGTQVNVYSVNGTQEGSTICRNGEALVNTNLQPGSTAIVKIGDKSVKIVVK